MSSRLRHPTTLLSVGFAMLAIILITTVTVSEGERRDERWVRHTLQVENQLSSLLSGLQDAETGQRGYVITGVEAYLEPYTLGQARIGPELDALARATSDNPRQQASLSRLRPLVQERMMSLGKGIEQRKTGGLAAASADIAQGRGKALMDEVRRQIGEMRREETRLLADRQGRATATRRTLRIVTGLGLLIFLGLSAFAVQVSARQVRELRTGRDELVDSNTHLIAEAHAREAAESQLRQMQKMESIGQLTGGIAHDFNNMLAVVIGSLELARRRLRPDPERAEACIDNALEGAQRAAGLTARLLAFSRQQPLAPTPLDPNKLVGGMSELLRRTIGEQLRVETVLAAGVWRVNVDAQQLENAILNLCVNARDAMPDGGNLTVETSNAYLDEPYAGAHAEVAVGQYVLISVTDTGVGMSEDVVQRAFDPFYTTKEPGRGTGLGLSQVFGFIKQSGGHIKLYSELGQGTSVKVYLPRWTGPLGAESQAAAPSPAPRARDHEIILLAEDDDSVRTVAADVLRELGYTVVATASGEEALQQLRVQPRVDLLLTDVVMPGMTGRILADQVLSERPSLKVLYMTGYTRNAIVHNGVLDPGVALLPKPFTSDQLASKMRQVLDGDSSDR